MIKWIKNKWGGPFDREAKYAYLHYIWHGQLEYLEKIPNRKQEGAICVRWAYKKESDNVTTEEHEWACRVIVRIMDSLEDKQTKERRKAYRNMTLKELMYGAEK